MISRGAAPGVIILLSVANTTVRVQHHSGIRGKNAVYWSRKISTEVRRWGLKVLVVEDDKHSRYYLSETMKNLGYETVVAEDGEAGLAAFRSFQPDLVFSDIRMPKMDGLELLSEIRKQSADVIVIITTAFGTEEYAIEALRRRANNYLPKPVRHSDMIPMLRKYEDLLKERTLTHEIFGMIVRREFTITFDNRISHLSRIVDRLMTETGGVIAKEGKLGVHLGLVEMLTNAIEHGNLAISSETKNAILEEHGFEGLLKEYDRRIADPTYRNRRVTVDFRMNTSFCEWFITDEGAGFNWKSLPDPTEEANLLKFHGRGIFLTRLQFDEFEYLDRGNSVRLKKNLV
jgi:CheY-like chemotaxis protein